MKSLDIAGMRVGMLTAEEPTTIKRKRKWICRCDCGGSRLVEAGSFTRGAYSSCGCKKQQFNSINIGDIFHSWTVIEKLSINGRKKLLCRCICGITSKVFPSDLINGRSKMCKSCGNHKKLAYGVAARNRLVRTYKQNAESRGRDFSLTDEDLDCLFGSPCVYCGQIESAIFMGKFPYNGIDRVDNDGGYTKENVVTCCFVCNRAKNSMPLQDFLNWLEAISRYDRSTLYGYDKLAVELQLEKSKDISLDLEELGRLGLSL